MSDHIYAQSEIFAVVRQLLKKYHAESAILFGSYARQEADAASDIDLIVVGGSKFDPTDIFCIAEELHRTMGKAVDVYELRSPMLYLRRPSVPFCRLCFAILFFCR